MGKQDKPPDTVFKILSSILLSGIVGVGCLLILFSGLAKPLGMNIRSLIDQGIAYTNSPTPIYPTETDLTPTSNNVQVIQPTKSNPQWTSQKLNLYNWNVELAPGWTIHEMNRRPEPDGEKWLGHDCADYQLASPDKMEFITITMPCGYYDGPGGGSCGSNIFFIQSVGNGKYLIRYPHPQHIGYTYEITHQWTWEDLSGIHTDWACGEPLKFGYIYWRIGHNMLDYVPGPEIDRMMLYMLTKNASPFPNP